MANQNFDFPSNSRIVDDQGIGTIPWIQVFSRWHRLAISVGQSGATAQRPTSFLWVGRRFFDTDLGKPIWMKDPLSSPVVWVDATGATV